jgi:predicted DNA binding CopG/RHH family protein
MGDELKLEAKEQDLLNSYERGEWQSISALREKLRQYQAYATAVLEADGLVNIVLPTEDLTAIRWKADEAGMSYQTFIAHLVHQFVSGSLIERPRA